MWFVQFWCNILSELYHKGFKQYLQFSMMCEQPSHFSLSKSLDSGECASDSSLYLIYYQAIYSPDPVSSVLAIEYHTNWSQQKIQSSNLEESHLICFLPYQFFTFLSLGIRWNRPWVCGTLDWISLRSNSVCSHMGFPKVLCFLVFFYLALKIHRENRGGFGVASYCDVLSCYSACHLVGRSSPRACTAFW